MSTGTIHAQNAVIPGTLAEDVPTVRCLGMYWRISGDDNRNAACRVEYRRAGDSGWQEGLPLFRVNPEGIAYSRVVPDMFAGSIFDLDPGTAYEVRLTLGDPDGGGDTRTLNMKTRPVPEAAAGATVTTVTPAGLQDAFSHASPGDILLVSPGTLNGTLTVTGRSGTAARPIVIRAAQEQTVIINGQGSDNINARGAKYIYLEGLVLTNGRNAVNAEGAVGLVLRKSRIENCTQGFYNADQGSPGRDFYIADNTFIGPYTWPETGINGEEAVQLCGQGHVVCFNRIYGWSDGVSILDFRGEPYPPNISIDIYNNEIGGCTDDAIEMDTGDRNVRAFRNRITDCFQGISTQPVYGGPCYIFRNVIYNVPSTNFKNYNEPSGVLYYHNTTIRDGTTGIAGSPAALLHYDDQPVRNSFWYNNLFFGNGGRAIESWGNYIGCDLDYNGYTDGPCAYTRDGIVIRTSNLAQFAAESGLELHGLTVDLSVFASPTVLPVDTNTHTPPDLRLGEGTPLDAGRILPNINDGYRGAGPDLGAYERGDALPVYGPRTGSSALPDRVRPAGPPAITFSLAPRPATSFLWVTFVVETFSPVYLGLFDPRGRLVATLADRSYPAGTYKLGYNTVAENLAGGNYIIKIKTRDYEQVKQVAVLK